MIVLKQEEASAEVLDHLGKQGYYHSVTYDTPLKFTNDPGDDPFHRFNLFGRPIIWINPVILDLGTPGYERGPITARVVIPCKSSEDFDGTLIMNRLASLLCFVAHGSPVSVVSYTGTGFPSAMMVTDLMTKPYTVVTHEAIDALINAAEPDRISDKKWVAIAQYRQGVIAKSPYYIFLSYWKIIELYFNDDSKEISKYLDNLFKDKSLASKLHQSNKTPSAKLYSTRNRCAHFALTQRKGQEIQDPDDPASYVVAYKDSGPLKKVVEELLINGSNW